MSTMHEAGVGRERSERPKEAPSFLLASASPRRRTLLSHLRVPFEVRSVECDESISPGTSAVAAVCELALRKLAAVSDIAAWEYVLTADTVVVAPANGDEDKGSAVSSVGGARTTADFSRADPGNDAILGKPVDESEAAEYLRLLSGRSHRVLTGVALYSSHLDETSVDYETTTVEVAQLSEAEISWYVDSGEWRDAAGGYRIQEGGSAFVTAVHGSASNVIGLPMRLVYSMLQKHRYPFR